MYNASPKGKNWKQSEAKDSSTPSVLNYFARKASPPPVPLESKPSWKSATNEFLASKNTNRINNNAIGSIKGPDYSSEVVTFGHARTSAAPLASPAAWFRDRTPASAARSKAASAEAAFKATITKPTMTANTTTTTNTTAFAFTSENSAINRLPNYQTEQTTYQQNAALTIKTSSTKRVLPESFSTTNPTAPPNQRGSQFQYYKPDPAVLRASSNNSSLTKKFSSIYTNPTPARSAEYKFDESNARMTLNSKPGPISTSTKEIILTNEQNRVLQLVAEKQSVFYTGSAGTGKSVLMREIVKQLRTTMTADQIAITAPTGIAAANIGGITLHSFVGCGLAQDQVAALVVKIKNNRKSFTRWRTTKVLIIDEISMVDGQFLDKIEEISRRVRDSIKPFGGMQLICCGDFMQLPPINKNALFAFEAKSWRKCMSHTIMLKEVFRQKDADFIQILNEIRVGNVSAATEAKLKNLERPLPPNDNGLVPTELFALRTEVDTCNRRHLEAIPGIVQVFKAEKNHECEQWLIEKLDKECMASDMIELKIGAQVMMIKNLPEFGLVNGSLGRVVGFEDPDNAPVVQFFLGNGLEGTIQRIVRPEIFSLEQNGNVWKKQIPLVLAYALSIHKSQGQTLPLLIVDLGKVFERGQSYVALSRAVSLEGLQVLRFNKNKVSAHPKVVKFNQELSSF